MTHERLTGTYDHNFLIGDIVYSPQDLIKGNNSIHLKLSWVDVGRRALDVYLVAHNITRLMG